jgi:hypothetical protein
MSRHYFECFFTNATVVIPAVLKAYIVMDPDGYDELNPGV